MPYPPRETPPASTLFTTIGANAVNPKSALPPHLQLVLQDTHSSHLEKPLTLMGMGVSSLIHLGAVVLIIALMILIDVFNWDFNLLDMPDLTLNPKTQLEYVVINNAKPEKPQNTKTKNRADVASRSGGVKTKSPRQRESQSQAGGTPSPAQQATRAGTATPASTPAPPKEVSRPQEKSTPSPSRTPSRSSQESTRPSQTPPENPVPKPQKDSQKSNASPSSTQSTTPRKKAIAVKKSTSSNASGGSPKPSPQNDGIGWDDPGPIMTKPSGSSGGGGGGSATRVNQGGGASGNSSQNRAASAANVKGAGGSGNLSSTAQSGGGGGVAGVDALPEPDMSPYIAKVNSRIARNWSPPDVPSSTIAMYNLRISKSGNLMSLTLKRSSGNANFDAVARSAAQASAPFGPLPAGVRDSYIDIEFTFDFNRVAPR